MRSPVLDHAANRQVPTLRDLAATLVLNMVGVLPSK